MRFADGIQRNDRWQVPNRFLMRAPLPLMRNWSIHVCVLVPDCQQVCDLLSGAAREAVQAQISHNAAPTLPNWFLFWTVLEVVKGGPWKGEVAGGKGRLGFVCVCVRGGGGGGCH